MIYRILFRQSPKTAFKDMLSASGLRSCWLIHVIVECQYLCTRLSPSFSQSRFRIHFITRVTIALPHFAVHIAAHVPHDVFVATTHQLATHLHNSQAQAQRLIAENAHLQGRVAELLKRVEKLQESFDLQKRVVQTQSELIQTLESEEAHPSPFLRSPI